MSVLYLDCNATTPIDPRVMEIVRYYMEEEFGNAGSRTHIYGQNAKKAVERAREQVAAVVNAKPLEVFFTSGATESNNIAILGLTEIGIQQNKKHIISTNIEHSAVLEPLQEMARRGFEVTLLPCQKNGRINAEDVRRHLRRDTLLVSIMHVNNETGVIQPIKEVADILTQENHDAYFHVDAAQGFGKILQCLTTNRIDLISISGHKIYAPKGVGALVFRRRISNDLPKKPVIARPKPIMFGGGQELGLRPGTLPVPLIAGLGLSAELSLKENESRTLKCSEIKKILTKEIYEADCYQNGDDTYCLDHIINLSFPNLSSETLLIKSKDLMAISNGAACASSHYQESHVLAAMNCSNLGGIRFSWSHTTDVTDLVNTIKAFKVAVKNI